MSARRRRVAARASLAAALLLLVAVAALALARREPRPPAPRPEAQRPVLLLLTSLPLIFAEQFSLEGGGSAALRALETRYRVEPIGAGDSASLSRGRLLAMAHPLAQPAEHLVEIDSWVRGGGRLLLLADPRLDWPSSRPLGDRLRPPPAFADTGLLAHWGLRLDAPEEAGPAERQLGGYRILAWSPGSLSGGCRLSRDGFVARCRIGKGRATVVADADFLNVEKLDGPKERNLDALLAELAALER